MGGQMGLAGAVTQAALKWPLQAGQGPSNPRGQLRSRVGRLPLGAPRSWSRSSGTRAVGLLGFTVLDEIDNLLQPDTRRPVQAGTVARVIKLAVGHGESVALGRGVGVPQISCERFFDQLRIPPNLDTRSRASWTVGAQRRADVNMPLTPVAAPSEPSSTASSRSTWGPTSRWRRKATGTDTRCLPTWNVS